MADENLDGFLSGLQGRLLQSTASVKQEASQSDKETKYLCTPAPNAIEWTANQEFLDVGTVYYYTRQYQLIRDFFQLRCPLPSCNPQTQDARDCWGKGREYLQSENLLIYSSKYNEDVCPCCGSTRSELSSDGLLKSYNQLHAVVGMRTLDIKSHVLTSAGLKRLCDLLPSNPLPDTFYPVDNLKVYGINGWEEVSDVYYSGVLPSKILKLQNGIEHRISHVHPIYGFNNGKWGWHRAGTLTPGAYVTTHVSDSWFGSNDVTEDEAALMGYLIAEGSINTNKSWDFTNGDDEIINHFQDLLMRRFSYSGYIYTKNGTTCKEVQACNADMRTRLRGLGLNPSVAHNKVVPESIWSARESAVSAYLRAYFEGDGTVAIEKSGGTATRQSKPAVACYTVSKQLALDTQQLLLNLGIECSITASKSRRFGTGGLPFEHDLYSIRIYGRNILTYAQKVGFNSTRKKAALEDCVRIVLASKSKDVAVPGLMDLLNSIHDKIEFSADICSITSGVRSGRYGTLSRQHLSIVIEYIEQHKIDSVSSELKLLKLLSDPTSRFIKIKSIEDGPAIEMADLHVPGTHSFVANSVMNHNSGKSATAAIMGTFIEHKILTIAHRADDRLDRYFEQLAGQPFEMTFIASTEVQSADTIWAKFVGLRQSSPWITRYIKWIKQRQLAQATINGSKPWEYRELDRVIEHGLLNLKIDSKNSSSSGLAGRTRLASFVDELARFENTDTARGGDEAYRVLENSLKTVRQKSRLLGRIEIPWIGTMVSISSPISDDDKAMRLLKQAPSIADMYYANYATWEFNPDYPRSSFDSDFAKDPVGSMRDFGAKPPSVASPLIQDQARFRDQAIQADLKPTAEFKKILHVDRTGREYISAQVTQAQLLRDGQRFISFDAGSSFDQFAGACAHGEWVETVEGRQLVTVYDWVIRLLPESTPKREIWFDFVISLIDYIKKYCNIGRVEFDRWQSNYLIQLIRQRGIPCEMKGTTVDQFNKFINDVTYSKVRMLPPMPGDDALDPPSMSAQGLAFYELEHLERTSDLKKVHNPLKGQRRGYDSDDVATCIVHCNHMVQSQIIDIGNTHSPTARLRREEAAGNSSNMVGSVFKPRLTRRGW